MYAVANSSSTSYASVLSINKNRPPATTQNCMDGIHFVFLSTRQEGFWKYPSHPKVGAVVHLPEKGFALADLFGGSFRGRARYVMASPGTGLAGWGYFDPAGPWLHTSRLTGASPTGATRRQELVTGRGQVALTGPQQFFRTKVCRFPIRRGLVSGARPANDVCLHARKRWKKVLTGPPPSRDQGSHWWAGPG